MRATTEMFGTASERPRRSSEKQSFQAMKAYQTDMILNADCLPRSRADTRIIQIVRVREARHRGAMVFIPQSE